MSAPPFTAPGAGTSSSHLSMSVQCAHYEKFALANYRDDPFPMAKHKLLRYIKVRARCSTFCDFMSDLEKHPLHGPAWLSKMNNDPDVQNLMKMSLLLWPRQAKQCKKPLIGIGLVNDSGIFEDAWTKLRREKEQEQALLNEKVRVIDGPKAKGYMVTDELPPAMVSSMPLQQDAQTASSISEQLKRLGNTPNQPIDLEKTPTANLTTLYVAANTDLIPQNDNELRKHLKKQPFLPHRELHMYRRARMQAFSALSKFVPESSTVPGDESSDTNKSSSTNCSYRAKEEMKTFMVTEAKKKKMAQESAVKQIKAFDAESSSEGLDDDVYAGNNAEDYFDAVDYTDDIMDEFDYDLFYNYQNDDMMNSFDDINKKDKGKQKLQPTDENSWTSGLAKSDGNSGSISSENSLNRIGDQHSQYEEPISRNKEATVVISKGLQDMYNDGELADIDSGSLKQRMDIEATIPEPTVVIDTLKRSARRPRTISATTQKSKSNALEKQSEPTVYIRVKNKSRERKDFLAFSKRSYATKTLSQYRSTALRHNRTTPSNQKVFSLEHLSPPPSTSPSPSSLRSTTINAADTTQSCRTTLNSWLVEQARYGSNSSVKKSESRYDTGPIKPINFFKRPRGRPRKVPLPEAIVRIKMR